MCSIQPHRSTRNTAPVIHQSCARGRHLHPSCSSVNLDLVGFFILISSGFFLHIPSLTFKQQRREAALLCLDLLQCLWTSSHDLQQQNGMRCLGNRTQGSGKASPQFFIKINTYLITPIHLARPTLPAGGTRLHFSLYHHARDMC
jgi:hypothetical protein